MTTLLRLRSISRLLTRSFSSSTTTSFSSTLWRSSLLNPNPLRSLPAATLPPPASLPSAFRTFFTAEDPSDKPKEKEGEEEPPVILDAQAFPTDENSSGKSKEEKEKGKGKEKKKDEEPPPPVAGCDFKHWLVTVDPPPPEWTREQIIDSYIKMLAKFVGSEDEARMKIYSVSTKHYYAFGALISQELSEKIDEEEGVQWVLPDCYLDVRNEDYGGEPFVNGKAAPYDPKYHREWVKNNQKAKEQSEKPRNADRPRNSDRRQNNPRPAGNAQRREGNRGGKPNQPRSAPSNGSNNSTPNHQASGGKPNKDTPIVPH